MLEKEPMERLPQRPLLRGLNINPIPLEFSQKLTTTEWLCEINARLSGMVEEVNNAMTAVEEYYKEYDTYFNEELQKAKEELERIKSQLKISSTESDELKKRISELEEYIDADARIEEESGDPLFGKYNVLKFGELMDNIGVALNPFMAQPEVFNYATLDEVKFAHEKVSTLLSYIGEIEEQLAQREEVLRKRKR